VFYLGYLRAELVRRKGRTILTMLGLALGVGLVIAIASLSSGLERAQKATLDPLAGIGTDLTVTRSVPENSAGPFGGPGGGTREFVEANQAAITDLSKLGEPGERFVHDFFLPGAQLTFSQQEAKEIAGLDGVAAVSSGLSLQGVHQEGKVPEIVARVRTGGDRIDVRRQIAPPTQAELNQIQNCIEKQGGGPQTAPGQGGLGGSGGGADPREVRGAFLGPNGGAFAKCLPKRMQEFAATITTPRETLEQVVNPPQTDIESESYTIAGVQTGRPGMGLLTAGQVTKGRFLSGGREAVISDAYASRRSLKVGSTLNLNETTFEVVGLAEPPLGGQGADVYVPLAQLQKLSGQKGLVNVVLVRADDSSSVALAEQSIKTNYGEAQVATSKQVADQISGSLVDAANLTDNLGLLLSIAAAAAAFLLAALLALSSVGKRVRELGTLKALGWTQGKVVRQIAGESLANGILGGVAGVVLGLVVIALINAFGPTLTASSTTGGFSLLGVEQAAETASRTVSLTAPAEAGILLGGFALALLGGLLAGAGGALRAARLRPADALRTLE
jgi:ABC-type antimicrobial peptide transport system permease subunit